MISLKVLASCCRLLALLLLRLMSDKAAVSSASSAIALISSLDLSLIVAWGSMAGTLVVSLVYSVGVNCQVVSVEKWNSQKSVRRSHSCTNIIVLCVLNEIVIA